METTWGTAGLEGEAGRRTGQAGAAPTVHWLDRLYPRIIRPPLCMTEGWGDSAVLALVGEELFQVREPAPLVPRWGRERRWGGMRIVDGTADSPLERLAPECRRAHVRWLLPAGRPVRGVYLLLSAWADEGYLVRTWLASPLVREGFGFLLLENAFYGLRRGPGQRGAGLRRFSDLILMGLAIFHEARGLLAFLRAEGYRAGIAGYSMGGQFALMAGATLPWPLPIVGMAPPASPVEVFTQGPLQTGMAWAALGGADAPSARTRLRELLSPVSVLAIPPPADPSRAIIVGTTHDGIVSPREMEAIAAHWRGAELRWLPAGHVSALLLHRDALRQALRDAFQRAWPAPG